ncbi:MAG: hypothetical protein HY752_03925 [Nitrospirae bacterium]|nr:hypothetical protein [Nitrospirota bacterium]
MKKLFLRTGIWHQVSGIRYGLIQSLPRTCFGGLIVVSIALLLLTSTAYAFDSGSTGADGAFNPTANTEVTLPADGKLNYTTVNIPTDVTVTFKKNSANTPVYILATGDVTIAGTINVNGTDGSGIYPGRGGAGGFDGGLGGYGGINNQVGGKGLGPGGGNPGDFGSGGSSDLGGAGGGGGFGLGGSNATAYYAPGGSGGGTYGNEKILPAIGGSGGGGGAGSKRSSCPFSGGGGGGGGGAILIASSGTIRVTGSITANAGKGGNGDGGGCAGGGGGGSGGAIKLMAGTIDGNGTISASGGVGGTYFGGAGGGGRIRFEANNVSWTGTVNPANTYSYPSTVFITNIPTLSITSVGGVNVPASPSGKYGSPDVTLPSTTTNPVTVNISGANIPVGTQVTVTSVPEYGNSTSVTGALSGTDASSTTSVSVTLSTSYQSILTATVTFTVQIAMYWDNEKIEKVRVATTMGKGSEVTYITEKGREIKAELLAGLMK